MIIADLIAKLRMKVDSGSFTAADRLLTMVKRGVAGVVAFASVQWARGLIDQTVQLGGAIADLSQKIGVPAETLQQLGYAAQLSGGSMESLGNSLGKLSKLAFDASKGSKEASETFKDLGVRVKGADGSLRPAEDLLADIAETISKMPDGTEKTALAMRAFGRSGKDLIPLLNEGREGIAKLRQEFVELGGQIDGETASALEAFGDEQDKVKVALDGVRNQIVIALLPHLRAATEWFLKWWKANRLIVRQRLERVFTIAGKALKIFLSVADTLVGVIQSLVKLIVHWGEIIIWFARTFDVAIAAVLGAILAFKTASIAAAIQTTLAWAAAAAPFVLLALAIAGIILVVEDLWVGLRGGRSLLIPYWKPIFKQWMDDVFFFLARIENRFKEALETVLDVKRKILGQETRAEREDRLSEEQLARENKEIDERNARTERRLGFLGQTFQSPQVRAANDLIRATEMAQLVRTEAPVVQQSAEDRARSEAWAALSAGRVNQINAPITINAASADPVEVVRRVREQIDSIIRMAE